MSTATSIEWTRGDDGSAGTTWNPTTGCDRISPGCDHCYALTMARRLKAMGQAKYQADGNPRTSGPGFGLTLHPEALNEPYKWRKPRKVFVNSMSDLLHARVPLAFLERVFEVMEATPQHTYQILTKRARRLARLAGHLPWPDNVWMGVSVESSDQLHRVDDLRAVPASVRWISAEPLLGPLDGLDLTGIAWIVVGGESGPRARPIELTWVRGILAQARQAAQPPAVFVKQLGSAWSRRNGADAKGGDPRHWPADLRVRDYPERAR